LSVEHQPQRLENRTKAITMLLRFFIFYAVAAIVMPMVAGLAASTLPYLTSPTQPHQENSLPQTRLC
jgi:hypothetical protein